MMIIMILLRILHEVHYFFLAFSWGLLLNNLHHHYSHTHLNLYLHFNQCNHEIPLNFYYSDAYFMTLLLLIVFIDFRTHQSASYYFLIISRISFILKSFFLRVLINPYYLPPILNCIRWYSCFFLKMTYFIFRLVEKNLVCLVYFPF